MLFFTKVKPPSKEDVKLARASSIFRFALCMFCTAVHPNPPQHLWASECSSFKAHGATELSCDAKQSGHSANRVCVFVCVGRNSALRRALTLQRKCTSRTSTVWVLYASSTSGSFPILCSHSSFTANLR